MNAPGARIAGYVVAAVAAVWLVREAFKRFAGARRDDGGTAPGGLPGAIGDVFGGGDFSDVRPGDPYGGVPPPPAGASKPVDFILARFLSPTDGGAVNRALFGSSVRFRLELTNTAALDWRGPLTLQVHEDYLITDAKGVASETVTVPARSSVPVDIDYRLGANLALRNPVLWANLFAGQRHVASVGPVEVI